jgi:hypothetical protein
MFLEGAIDHEKRWNGDLVKPLETLMVSTPIPRSGDCRDATNALGAGLVSG